MLVVATKEERERRGRQLDSIDIKRLFSLYYKRYKAADIVGAMKIAWILSRKYGIEGNHSFQLGASQE